jgi:hypothetical protein
MRVNMRPNSKIIESTINLLYDLDDSMYAKIVVPESYSGEYNYTQDIDYVLKITRSDMIDILEYNSTICVNIVGDANEKNIISSIYENW